MSNPTAEVAWLAIICTDRNTHKRTRLATVHFDDQGSWRVSAPGAPRNGGTWDVVVPEGFPERWYYEFRCPRCGRNPRVNAENWRAAMQRHKPSSWAGGASHADIDLSLVPF